MRRAALLALLAVAGSVAGAGLAQGVTEVTISGGCGGVYDAGGYCIDNPTPAQRRDAEERDRKQRERDEADRRARVARQAEFDRKVDALVDRMGPHRRAEAERLVKMRDAADAVRPKPKKACPVTRQVRYVDGDSSVSQAEARQRAEAKWAASCSRPGWSCGPITCAERKPINISLGKQTLSSGTKSSFVCSAPASEEVRSCPSTVSSQ
ncbi:hypothetical protein ACFOMD_01095 [Sphingoaurantiacus capsulatus]|uniref:DUF4124 domain-containing protein n=1 Tax=Sphingoaurantiacus capsulatus TaxID=1771310 RepID=A0ABV7X5P0_9SPHN